EAGADVVATARTQTQIDETAVLIRATGRRCLVVSMDVTKSASVQAMADATIAEFGRIDILVNNAGGATRGWSKPVEAITDEQWHTGIDTNLSGTFYCCRAVIPHLLRQGGGKIINVTSGFGVRAAPNNFLYTSAKAGLINFTRALAMTYAERNIQSNLILPGIFPHDDPKMVQYWQGGKYIPVGRTGRDDELGPAVIFLASDLSSYMNGEMIALEGGGLAGSQAPLGFAPVVPLEEGDY
ncbi:MAG: SDR family NAD(P)-dependent oxidoreductase, partial [Candidatus Binatia bacterium]